MTERDIQCRNAYVARNHILKTMGFECYKDYLASPLWIRLRSRLLHEEPKCCLCDGKATQVHHGSCTREILEGKHLCDFYSLCRHCHRAIEFDNDGNKLSPGEATHKLRTMIAGPKVGRKARKRARHRSRSMAKERRKQDQAALRALGRKLSEAVQQRDSEAESERARRERLGLWSAKSN